MYMLPEYIVVGVLDEADLATQSCMLLYVCPYMPLYVPIEHLHDWIVRIAKHELTHSSGGEQT